MTGPGQRPQWLLNITNDAWFGLSSGPYQHLTSARLRTIEEGLPMIRAANTGVSAVIDAYGRVLASLDMQQEGIIDHRLPAPRVATPYARWGDWTLLVLVAFLGVTLIGTRFVEEPTTPMNHSTLGIPRISLHYPGERVMSYAALTCRYAFLHR